MPAVGDRDIDDLRQSADSPDPFPPEYYVAFLQNATVMRAIGAEVVYSECSDPVGDNFGRTGDDARTLLPQLSALADSGLKMLIWVRARVSCPVPPRRSTGADGRCDRAVGRRC